MLVMVVFFIAFRWIHLSTPLIRLFLLVLILLLMPTLNFLPVWFIPSTFKRPVSSWKALNLRSEERFSRNAETDLVCRLLLEKKKQIADLLPLQHIIPTRRPPHIGATHLPDVIKLRHPSRPDPTTHSSLHLA